MSSSTRIIKNTGYLYAKMGITMFISLYTTRLILNALGASDFGIFNIVGGAIGMLGFLHAALAGATQRFMSYAEGEGNERKLKSIFNVSLVLHFSISLIVGVVFIIAGYFFFNGILNIQPERIGAAKIVYGSFIISTMFSVMSVPYDAVLNAHENMKYYSLIGVIESLLKLVVAFITVYYSSDKLIIYGLLMAVIPLVSLTIMRIYCHKHYVECVVAPRKYWDKGIMKEVTAFAGWNFLGTSSSMFGNYGLGIVVNHFFGTIVNAAIGVAGQLNGQLLSFSNNMMKAVNPVIVKREGGNDRSGMLRFSFLGCKYSFLLLAFFAIPFLIETHYVLRLWLKNVPEYSVIFLRLQLFKALLELLTVGLGTSLAATGKIKEINTYSIFLNLLPLPILWYLFSLGFPPYWMYIIAAIFMTFGGSAFKLYYSIKYCSLKINEFNREVLYPAAICFFPSFILGLALTFLMEEGLVRLLFCTALTCTSFIAILYFFIFTRQERSLLINLFSKFKLKLSRMEYSVKE